ncbi:MAG: guanylate kinase, partial [Kiritimatiellaeota bacterium]|nr:guanylate kinase [Kiritimatiellota bacterium]
MNTKRKRLLKPLLIIIAAPSGAGKSTLCDALLGQYPEITYSVSCTTREPRGAEEDGVDYFFLSGRGFMEKVNAGEFLEHATVHGNLYGTLKAPVYEAFKEGCSVLMDIDVQGAAQVREAVAKLPPGDPLREGFVDIFILPPDMETLFQRLEARGEDSAESITLRLENARVEMEGADAFR